jgi:hypothetical protein
LQVPLEITAAGVVMDGHGRLRAARELGLSELEVRVVEPADELEHILRAALVPTLKTSVSRGTPASARSFGRCTFASRGHEE